MASYWEKSSPYELTLGVELGPNLHSKMVLKSVLDPLKRVTHHIIHAPSPKSAGLEGAVCIRKNLSFTSTRDKVKIEYISRRQPSPYELALEVELGPDPHSNTCFTLFLIMYDPLNTRYLAV